MQIHDYLTNPNWHDPKVTNSLFEWATSPEIEESGEARRQLGYFDGYKGEPALSQNADYLRGYQQGVLMRNAQI